MNLVAIVTLHFLLFVPDLAKSGCNKGLSSLLFGELVQPRTTRGRRVDTKDFPYIVSVNVNGAHRCGGSLVGPKTILTAAHCVDGSSFTDQSQVNIRIGSALRNKGGIILPIDKLVLHPDYQVGQSHHDIALIHLELDVLDRFDIPTAIIPLWEGDVSSLENDMSFVIGWGYTSEYDDVPSPFLQQAFVPIVPQEECKKEYAEDASDMKFCAGWCALSADFCTEDDGGPLVMDDMIVGVRSGGHGCGIPHTPALYVSVPAYKDWIKENAGILMN